MCSSLSDLHSFTLAYSTVHSIPHNLVFKVAENLHLCGMRLYADGDQHMPHGSAAAGEPQPAHLADDEDTDDEADREVRELNSRLYLLERQLWPAIPVTCTCQTCMDTATSWTAMPSSFSCTRACVE